VIGTLAIREAIGKHRMLVYYLEQQVSRLILDDAPRIAAVEQRLLDDLLRGFDVDLPAGAEADVVGPFAIDQARAREIAEHFGARVGDVNLATVDFEENWPPDKVMLVVGAHVASRPQERMLRVEVRDGRGAVLALYVAKEPMLPPGPFRVSVFLDDDPVGDATIMPVIAR
jgi:hypothetical protein